jgi:RNA-directed DNA polymerase
MGLLTEKELATKWLEIDWETYESILASMQRGIALAAIKRDYNGVRINQRRLVNSNQAKAIAVRHVCNSVTQAGIDKIKWETDAEKMQAAMSLNPFNYISKPMRLITIRPRGSTKERHIQIPVYFDRAMQALHSYALDPVSESTGDKKSCAFRKGRSQFDVHAYLVKAFEMYNPPKYIVKADIKACYGSISHEWLLNNIPMETSVLKQFLRAGHVFNGELFPPDDFGITLGSSISPILANMCLDGMQYAIYDGLYGRVKDVDYADGNLVRFADDIIVTARTKETAQKILKILSSFLAVRGLSLSPTKTRIVDLADGFEFLSRRYQYSDGFVYSTPSDAAVAKMEQSIIALIKSYRGGQKALIDKLNKKLVGWANYHKVTEATQAFRHIDNLVKTLLLDLCEKLHPHTSREKIIDKYFYKEPDGEYIYILENKPDVRVHRISKTILTVHQPLSVNKNPYLDDDYYETRTDRRAITSVTGKYKPIWLRQEGKCYYCGKPILADDRKDLVTINPARNKSTKNLAYVHEYCKGGQAEFYNSDFEVGSNYDLCALLTRMQNETRNQKQHKYRPLLEYFNQRDEAVFTLTFEEIEKIIGRKLPNSAIVHPNFWYSVGETVMSFSWTSNGYKIRKLDRTKKRVVFERKINLGDFVNIPSVFLSSRLPPAARAEMDIMFEYIRKKYGL